MAATQHIPGLLTVLIRSHLDPVLTDLTYTPTITRDGTISAPAPRGNSRAHNRSDRPGMVRRIRLVTGRTSTITLRHSLHSVLKELLKEFLNPPRTSDPDADFFAVYRKESNDFDRDYAARYEEDFNTTLVFVS